LGEEARFDARFRSRFWRIALASALMGAALWGGWVLLEEMLETRAYRILALALLIALGMASYAIAAFALKAVRLSDLKALRRQR
jgi:putative peptidoglycan lipid II flippase